MNQVASKLLRTVAALTTLLVAGCAGPKGRVPDEHIVMINFRGTPVDPTDQPILNIGHYREVDKTKYKQQLDRIVAHIAEYAQGFSRTRGQQTLTWTPGLTDVSKSPERMLDRAHQAAASMGEPNAPIDPLKPRVVIFIHGGLNTQTGSVVRAVELHSEMLADGVYPVFINWQSSLFSSYWDHLFLVRYGEERQWQAWLTAPFVVAEDLLRAIGRAPMTIYSEISGAFRSTDMFTAENQRLEKKIAAEAIAELDAEFPELQRNPGTGVGAFARDVVLMIPHMVLGILIDIGGTSSWEQMHRRTTLLMESEESYRADSIAQPTQAAVPQFLAELTRVQAELRSRGIDLQVDIVGHSMGCIITNLILGTANAQVGNDAGLLAPDPDALPIFTNIVYMADADSVQKTERAVYPYLLGPAHGRTQFFQLSLNDKAEFAESSGFYLAPKGSLLVWIDHFFEATPSMPDQRAGKMQSQLFSMHRIPPSLRERMHFKSFLFDGDDSRENPRLHGDFTTGKFWRDEYFRPRRATSPKQ